MRALLIWLALSSCALARVGGGQNYGGGGGSDGGSGGGDGGLIYFLIRLLLNLCIEQPVIGIPLTLAVVGGGLWYYSRSSVQFAQWSSQNRPVRSGSTTMKGLMSVDPNFSRPLFMDFIGLLYTRAQTEKVAGLSTLAAYLSSPVREQLEADVQRRGLKAVDEVIVGSVRVVSVTGLREAETVLAVEMETNYTERTQAGATLWYGVEKWYLGRRTGILSQGPQEITKLACPSCGNPGELRPDGTCPFCDKHVSSGEFAWSVKSIQVVNRTQRPPTVVGWSGEEVGTDLPTLFQNDFEVKKKQFQTGHPDFSWSAFETRAKHIFLTLQSAWSERHWDPVRPFETDSLFQTHRYWMSAYEQQGLFNRLEDVALERIIPVRIETDAYFDAITVRIFASMKDYTVDSAGKVVSGMQHQARRFSEYWTFLRRTGTQQKRTAEDPGRCPSCGAPLDKVNMAGVCEYCGSKLTSGDFDWVLSRIEQDEAYES